MLDTLAPMVKHAWHVLLDRTRTSVALPIAHSVRPTLTHLWLVVSRSTAAASADTLDLPGVLVHLAQAGPSMPAVYANLAMQANTRRQQQPPYACIAQGGNTRTGLEQVTQPRAFLARKAPFQT